MKEDSQEMLIEPIGRFSIGLSELWQYRELFYFFTWRDLKVRYKQTTLGVLWVIIQPILTVAIFSVFFGQALKMPSIRIPYPVFVFSGLLIWNFFASSLNNAGNSMVNQSSIIKKIYFPRMIIPVSAVLVSLIDFFIAFIVFVMLCIYYQVKVDVLQVLIYWPLAFVSMVSGTVGLSCWLSALTVKYRDFRYVIPFALQVFLFLTPVIYPISIVKYSWINYVLAINPMYSAIHLFRTPLVTSIEPPVLLMISLTSSVALILIGVLYFRKTENFFADIA